MSESDFAPVTILYKNWRGVVAWRRVLPLRFYRSASEYHPIPGVLMDATDLDRKPTVQRTFAMSGLIHWCDGLLTDEEAVCEVARRAS